MRFQVSGGPDVLRPAAERTAAACAQLGVPRDRLPAVTLAIHELLANAREHGHLGDPTAVIDVEVARDGDGTLTVRVTDTARGGRWDPAPRAPTPGDERGRGLALVRAELGAVRIERSPGRTCVSVMVATESRPAGAHDREHAGPGAYRGGPTTAGGARP